jgi:hypothetical protein
MKIARRFLFFTATCTTVGAIGVGAYSGDWAMAIYFVGLLVGLPILYKASL